MKTALQEFIEWGDEMMMKYPMKELGFGQAIDKAEELLKKEKKVLEEYWNGGIACTEDGNPSFDQFERLREKEPHKLCGYLNKTKSSWEVAYPIASIPLHPDDIKKILKWKFEGIEVQGKVVWFKRVIEKIDDKSKPLVKTYAKLIEEEL